MPVTQGTKSVDAVDRLVGRNIRERRKVLMMTQKELGSDMGSCHQQLHKFETGMNRLKVGDLRRAAQALQCRPSDLFCGCPSPQPRIGADALEELMGVAQALPPDRLALLCRYVRQVAAGNTEAL